MAPPRKDVPTAELVAAYSLPGATLRTVADQFRISYGTVRTRLMKARVRLHPRGHPPKPAAATPAAPLVDTIRAWLQANGIPPADVLISAVPTIRNGHIVCDVLQYQSVGGKRCRYIDATTGEPARAPVTVVCKVPPPAQLAGWLTGQVPAVPRR